jgi:hypothetical protein
VYITEGANKSAALIEKSLLATAAPYHQWAPECVSALAGCHLIYLADHNPEGGDDPAMKLAASAQKKLAPGAASFRVVPTAHLWKYLPPSMRPIGKATTSRIGSSSAVIQQSCSISVARFQSKTRIHCSGTGSHTRVSAGNGGSKG